MADIDKHVQQGNKTHLTELFQDVPNLLEDPRQTLLWNAVIQNDYQQLSTLLGAGVSANFMHKDANASPLYEAARRDYIILVEALVDAGSGLELGNVITGCSPFIIACAQGHTELANVLYQAGCKTNATDGGGKNALHCAADHGHIDTIRFLLKVGKINVNSRDDEGRSPLMYAVAGNKHRAVGHLLKNGASPSQRNGEGMSSLMISSKHGLVEMSKVLIHEKTFLAGSLSKLTTSGQQILMHGNRLSIDDGDSCNQTALFLAVKGGHSEIVRLLLNAGADVAIATWVDKSRAFHASGETPLLCAIRSRNMLIADMLLSTKGIDVNQPFTGRGVTPLHWAIHLDCQASKNWNWGDRDDQDSAIVYLKIIKCLVEHEADVNTHDNDWQTPLHTACHHGNKAVVELLLNAGSNVNRPARRATLTDQTGRVVHLRPIEVAMLGGHWAIVKLLVEAGAVYSVGTWQAIPEINNRLEENSSLCHWLEEQTRTKLLQ